MYTDSMYTRELTEPPKHIIQNGKPVFGTFNAPFNWFDIRGVKDPYITVPLPRIISNLRIRSTLSITFNADNYIGLISVLDAKFFGYLEVVLWDKTNNKKLAYRKIMGPRRRFIPKNLHKGVFLSLSRRRYARISWNREQNRFSILFKMKGDSVRPTLSAALMADFKSPEYADISSVSPAPVTRRCLAAHTFTTTIQGSLSLSGNNQAVDIKGWCLYDIKKAYYPLRTKSDSITAMGIVNGKTVSFKIASSNIAAADEYSYNQNVLFVNGKTWPLPPVRITRPGGLNAPWIIQDTESMVDLQFTPISANARKNNALILSSDFHIVYGTLDGILLTGETEALPLKNFAAIGKKLRLRL